MENASKALLIAGSLLISLMVVSTAIYFYKNFKDAGNVVMEQLSQNKIDKFNSEYLKYNGHNECTIHDVLSIANSASQNNVNYYGIGKWKSAKNDSSNIYYIIVTLETKKNKYVNLEQEESDTFKYLLQNYSLTEDNKSTIHFTCNVKINEKTLLVNKVEFVQNNI